ncbi:tetratricopeptide repeat protein [Natronospira bacteriovora]|uniref:Tetratricopeptide repeat protein n=1 Tax=Natronospira bacteriovora TaxID=3069753 RepID=A0ABU0W326_9GAMM|nr:tetratricopeptide repeat protein [Natronospira sp. AB-CW4]MDQ2068420.1 tetratricopeptide repeat protein [Natronospira sp. AB-CW4]
MRSRRHIATTWILASTLGALVTACAGVKPAQEVVSTAPAEEVTLRPVFNSALFEPLPAVPSAGELTNPSDRQSREFLSFYHAEERRNVDGHRRLRDYLERRLSGFDYRHDTLAVSEALELGQGNCMSLAAVTYGLTELVGLDIEFQLVNTPPVFDRDERTVVSSNHVRSRVFQPDYEPAKGHFPLQRPHIVIDYFPSRRGIGGRRINQDEFLAMFYRNLSAEALLNDDPSAAFAFALEALAHKEAYPDALNLLAILHRRAGDIRTAEAIYNYAVNQSGDRVDLLNNHINLLRAEQRHQEADILERRLAQLPDDNPFRWIELGEQARQQGAYAQALKWFSLAIERAPYLHEGYWRKAVVLAQMGQYQRSAAALSKASELAHRPNDQRKYMSKMQTLTEAGIQDRNPSP